MPTVFRLIGVLMLLAGLLFECGLVLLAVWQGSAATSDPPLHAREWLIVVGFGLGFGLVVWLVVRSLFRWGDRIELNRRG